MSPDPIGSAEPDESGELPFPAEEFARRRELLLVELERRDLDALVVVRPENIVYATGYRAAHVAARTSELHVAVLLADGTQVLVARSLERRTVTTQCATPVLYADHDDPYAALVASLGGRRMLRVGVEERFLSVRRAARLGAALGGAQLVDASGLVESVASRLSAVEVAAVEQSAWISEIGLRAGLAEVRQGRRAHDAVAAAHDRMYRAGQSDFDKSLVAVWAGPRGGRMHDTAATHLFAPGDVATVEVMGVDRHYRTCGQASVFVGERPPAEIVEAHALIVEMHRRAVAAVRPGATTGEVFAAADAVYRAARGSGYYRRVGGSMGLTNFAIDLVRDGRHVLEPGTPILVQTLVDDPVLVAIGSTVVVTDSGARPLTTPVPGLGTSS